MHDEDASTFCKGLFFVTSAILLLVLGTPVALALLLTFSHHSILLVRNVMNNATYKEPSVILGFIVAELLLLAVETVATISLPLVSAWLVLLTIYRLPIVAKKMWTQFTKNSPGAAVDMESSYYMVGVLWDIVFDILTLIVLFIPILVTIHRLPTLISRLKNCSSYENAVESWTSFCWEEFLMIGTCLPGYDHFGTCGAAIYGVLGAFLFLPWALFSLLCAIVALLTFSHRAVILIRFLHLNNDWSPGNVTWSLFYSAWWILIDLVVFASLPMLAWYAPQVKR